MLLVSLPRTPTSTAVAARNCLDSVSIPETWPFISGPISDSSIVPRYMLQAVTIGPNSSLQLNSNYASCDSAGPSTISQGHLIMGKYIKTAL